MLSGAEQLLAPTALEPRMVMPLANVFEYFNEAQGVFGYHLVVLVEVKPSLGPAADACQLQRSLGPIEIRG